MSELLTKIKGFLLTPTAAFSSARADSLSTSYQYYVILLVIFSILYGIVSYVTAMDAFGSFVTGLAAIPILGDAVSGVAEQFVTFIGLFSVFWTYVMFLMGLVTIFISGFIYHLFVLLMGGEKGIVQTLKCTMYAQTPALLLGWIPFINIIAFIWYLILQIVGIKEMQEITTGKAILVVLIPLILSLIFVVILAAMVIAFVGGIGSILAQVA